MEKGKVFIVLVFTAALLAVGSAQTAKPPSSVGPVGRYQLLFGEHEVANLHNNSFVTQKGIFRIDTVTGATSAYSEHVDADGKYFNEWTPIEEFGSKR